MKYMNRFSVFFTFILVLICSVGTVSAKRIVSLAPSLTKNIQYLGVENELVGCTSYCKTTRKIPIVASAIKVNIEKVVAQKPDLVVASTLTSPETIESLRKMKLNVVVFPMSHSYAEICSQFLRLGKMVGHDAQARQVIAATNRKITALKAKRANGKKIFIQLGSNPLVAVISNTFMDDYITFAGGKNIFKGKTRTTITRESVLAQNPDAIFIVTMGIVADQEKKEWERFSSLPAARNHKIFIIDSDKACTPTPVTFAESLETIIRDLN